MPVEDGSDRRSIVARVLPGPDPGRGCGCGGAMATSAGNSVDVFVGRDAELVTLRAEMERARAGSPRIVLIEGPAGIGKTALLERFLDLDDDLRILRAGGEQWEAFVPYGIVDQLTRGTGISRARILAGREWALPPDEPISVGGLLLDLLGELDGKRPVVIVIDDAQWADLDS